MNETQITKGIEQYRMQEHPRRLHAATCETNRSSRRPNRVQTSTRRCSVQIQFKQNCFVLTPRPNSTLTPTELTPIELNPKDSFGSWIGQSTAA